MRFSKKTVEAGKTQIWNRPEKDVVYLISEFIDNSKTSYENLISKGKKDVSMIINVNFNQKDGYINISDKGEGFNILNSIQNIGRDSIQIGKTNQYFIGMKSAMNFFGDFSILISERIINGNCKRFANYFIYNNEILAEDVELESNNETGSEIYLFSNYLNAKTFWKTLNFKNKELVNSFPDLQDLNSEDFVEYSITMKFLNSLNEYFPSLAASLFRRYSFLVNKYENIKIVFECLDINGNSKLKNNHNKIVKNEDNLPIFLKEISKNNFNKLASFSFDKFKSINKKLYLNISFNEEKKAWTNFLKKTIVKDFKIYFGKLEKNTYDLCKKSLIGLFPDNFKFKIDLLDEMQKKGQNLERIEELSNKPFAKYLAEVFLNKFILGEGNLSDINFEITNLVIDNFKKIITARSLDEQHSFNLKINFFISSNRYMSENFKEKFGDIKIAEITGMQIVQNNRAIYHGPNTNMGSKRTISGNPMPENILVKELNTRNIHLFPDSWTKTTGTEVKFGGNTNNYMSKLFGEINLENDINFKSGTNKSKIDNLELLKNYILEIISYSGLPVIVKWAHILDNVTKKISESNNYFDINYEENLKTLKEIEMNIGKFKKITFFNAFLLEKVKNKLDNLKLIENVKEHELKEIEISEKEIHNEKKVDENNFSDKISEIKNRSLINESETLKENSIHEIMEFIAQLLRNNKNSIHYESVIKNILNYEQNTFYIKLKGKATNRWLNNLSLKFDFNSNSEFIKYNFNEDKSAKRIEFIIPLLIDKYDTSEIEKKIKIILENIINPLPVIEGYNKIQIKYDKKNTITEQNIKKYLNECWNKINDKNGDK